MTLILSRIVQLCFVAVVTLGASSFSVFICILFCFSPYLGQARVCSGCVPSADGTVPGPARPCREDRLSTEAVTGGCGPHQGRHLTGVHGEDTYPCPYTDRRFENINAILISAHCTSLEACFCSVVNRRWRMLGQSTTT